MIKLTITQAQLRTLAEMVDDGSFEEDTFREDYSGRGMYGDTCFGYVGSNPGAIQLELAALLAQSQVDNATEDQMYFDDFMDILREATHDLGSPRSDSMGLSTIYYWPNVSVEPATADADR